MDITFSTLIDALDSSAKTSKGIGFIKDLEQDEFVSYADLKNAALDMLADLQHQGIKQGDEVVLQYVSLKSMMQAFWACLMGGIIPIPLALADQGENARKVLTIWKQLQSPVLAFDDEKILQRLENYAEKHDYVVECDSIKQSLYNHTGTLPISRNKAQVAQIDADDIAFIQFSSGSTGKPKGVTLTHKNLLSNALDIMASVDHTDDDVFLSWKPISHDFGMIGFHITPIVGMSDQYRIPTDSYIWSPSLWFRAVNKYRASILGSPNFGYRHFLKLYKRGNKNGFDWDLSCVKAIFNGAEPISIELCDEFSRELEQYGLPSTAMRCGYGLAEGSLIASLCLKNDGVSRVVIDRQHVELGKKIIEVSPEDPNAIGVVDCGLPYPNTQIRIASPSGRTLSDGSVGYIEIRGSSVTKGYYLNKEATQNAIKRSGWLNTQDLGFMLDGRLYIAGRSKEMIIVGGCNYFPQDIEQAILSEIGSNDLNRVVACSVNRKRINEAADGSLDVGNQSTADECLAIFVYHKKKLDGFSHTIETIKKAVLNSVGIEVDYVVPVKKIPKTTSGKIQRFELIQQFERGDFNEELLQTNQFYGPESVVKASQNREQGNTNAKCLESPLTGKSDRQDSNDPKLKTIVKTVVEFASDILGVDHISESASFFDLGLTSIKLIKLQENLEKHFSVELPSTSALDFPTARKLAECFYRDLNKSQHNVRDGSKSHQSSSDDDIAIISMACRFPGKDGKDVETPEEFWNLLRNGDDPVREINRACWSDSALNTENLSTREGGFLSNIDQFDPHFFGISPTEADAMDPQQRLLLEVSFQAFENAGFNTDQLTGQNIGTYIGISGNDYVGLAHEQSNGIGPYTYTGSMFNTAAGRISYAFGLEGPCMAIDTACSSSLVSIHQACRELKAFGCDAALVGAVSLMLKPDGHVGFTKMNALAESGRCRSFDDSADGYIRSEGCAAVVLKRLADAEKDGDPVLAVIKASAVNHNGRSGGLTVPSGLAQQSLIKKAIAESGLDEEEIDYIEAHGSGTRLGDPQEILALSQVFAQRHRDLYLGSVKSNIGHCESAAGLAGLLKIVLSMQKQQLPANLHFKKHNTMFDWRQNAIKVVDRLMPWPVGNTAKSGGSIALAALTSLGISGSNAHLIIQAKQGKMNNGIDDSNTPPSNFASPLLFTFSAKSPAALAETIKTYRQKLESLLIEYGQVDETDALYQLSQALHFQRSNHPQRHAILAKDADELKHKLDRYIEKMSGQTLSKLTANNDNFVDKKIVFLFTGQGSEYLGMGDGLYQNAPIYRQAFDQCDRLFHHQLGLSVKDVIFGEDDPRLLAKTEVTQAAIFTIEYALATYWQKLGIKPHVVLGHSIGEYAAACIAGVITLETAVEMVALRGQVMETSNARGRMLGVLADENTVADLVREVKVEHGELYIAAYNAEENFTLAGTEEAIERVTILAKKARIFTEKLPMSHAYHSPLMRNSSDELKQKIQHIGFQAPQLTMLSSRTGGFINCSSEIDKQYWGDHLSSPVLYQQALEKLSDDGVVIVEIGAKATLTGLAAQTLSDAVFLPSLREGRGACQQFHESLASLFMHGADIDWLAFHGDKPPLTSNLPNTQFCRERYWLPAKSYKNETGHRLDGVGSIDEQSVVATQLTEACQQISVESPAKTTFQVTEESVLIQVVSMVSEVVGLDESELSDDVHLFSLGIDSLMFVQLDKRIQSLFQVEITLKDFFSEINTPSRIAKHIFENMPAELKTVQQPTESTGVNRADESSLANHLQNHLANIQQPTPINPMSVQNSNTGLERVIQNQLQVMQQQIAALTRPLSTEPNIESDRLSEPETITQTRNIKQESASQNNLRDIVLHRDEVTREQQAFINKITQEVNAATPKSKEYAENNRQGLADWVATLNFSLTTKEMTYPLVSAQSKGARFTDIDGNEYIDTAMGYGINLFGHNPDFITQALNEQLDKGLELGPQSKLAGDVVRLIQELTGVERVAFVNSGTEAVMVALRLARAVTKRDKIVRFNTSYHGSFDGILADNSESGVIPMAPGVPQSMVDDTLLMHYGTAQSLKEIEEQADAIAAVIVEPVQSRNPALQPREYLQQLRDLSEQKGIVLIFDEMIVGFRSHPGGAQAYFGIQADLVTYGKVVGGGMPIGVVAGKHEYMDAIDGGSWQFCDESGPKAETTFFAGTFCKHPLAMAAAKATLLHLKSSGYQLQESIAQLTESFAQRVNEFFRENQVPIDLKYFSSMYRLEPIASVDMLKLGLEMNLFFKLIQLENVFIWERRVCFFSSAHTKEDAEKIFLAIKNAVTRLRAGGFSFRALNQDYSRQVETLKPESEVCYDLSSEERRMYVLSHMKSGEQAYRICGALKVISSAFNISKLEHCVQQLARRHACLRSYYQIGEMGISRRENVSIETPFIYSDQPILDPEKLLPIADSFIVDQGPLWAIRVFKQTTTEYLIILDFSHLICDGISTSLFIEELFELYQDKELPPVGDHYSHYVNQQSNFVDSEKCYEQKTYWKTQLALPLAPLDLPADFSRPKQKDFAGDSEHFYIDEALTSQLVDLAKEIKVTPFLVLFSSYFVLLNKLSHQHDICVGLPFDNRGSGNFERSVGMFAQTLAIRSHLNSDLDFSQFVQEIKASTTDAYMNADLPLDTIVESLGLERDTGRNAIFDCMFIHEKGGQRLLENDLLSVSSVPIKMNHSAFDLTLEVTEEGNRLRCALIYATSLFNKNTIQQWHKYFIHLLQQVIQQPDQKISNLGILSDQETSHLLTDLNQTCKNYPQISINRLLEDRFSENADDKALASNGLTLSYRELDHAVDELASYLVAEGAGQGQCIAIVLDRSIDLIVSILAVLRSGAHYLPLDPTYPNSRLEYMLNKAEVEMVISQDTIRNSLTFLEGRDRTIIQPSQILSSGTEVPSGWSRKIDAAKADDLAYIIFTSGSSGQPKGVMVDHANVVNFVFAMQDELSLPERLVTLGLTTQSFDIFVLELFVTLASGGCLVLANEEQQKNPNKQIELMIDHNVNFAQMTPSRLSLLLNTSDATNALSLLDLILIGGEAFPKHHLAKLQSFQNLRIFNVYGPTETTVWSCIKELTDTSEVTIGKPIANTQAYVLDKNRQLLPFGSTGFLYLSGDGVSRGYFKDPTKNAEAFYDHPFIKDKTIYNTGDLAFWNENDELVYCGRNDFQIKLRGYRIELQEIENCLLNLPQIQSAAVVVRDLSEDNSMIVAFYAVNESIEEESIKQHMRLTLPEFMIPSVFMEMEELPTTENGKIARQKLPAGGYFTAIDTLDGNQRIHVLDNTEDSITRSIKQIWQDLTHAPDIGLQQSFFDVGGNSFNLILMHAKLNESYPGIFDVTQLFDNPTIAAIREIIINHDKASTELQGVRFPKNYFVSSDQITKPYGMYIKFDQKTVRGIELIADRYRLNQMDILLSGYALFLNKKLNQQEITLYIPDPQQTGRLRLDFDFQSINQLQELFDYVREMKFSLDKTKSETCRATPPFSKAEIEQAVSHLFLSGQKTQGLEHDSVFDLIFQVIKDEDLLALRVNVNQQRLSETQVHSLMNDYSKLMKAVVASATDLNYED